jgi:hypothetical protein
MISTNGRSSHWIYISIGTSFEAPAFIFEVFLGVASGRGYGLTQKIRKSN